MGLVIYYISQFPNTKQLYPLINLGRQDKKIVHPTIFIIGILQVICQDVIHKSNPGKGGKMRKENRI